MLTSVLFYYKVTTNQKSNTGIGQELSQAIVDTKGAPAVYLESLNSVLARQSKAKIWASMGLCYSHNTQNFGKKNYPYKQVLPLALLLWRYHLPQVNTIVRLVHTEPELNAEMKSYEAILERAGAVVEWIPAGNMKCPTMSQLVRSHTEIEPGNSAGSHTALQKSKNYIHISKSNKVHCLQFMNVSLHFFL